MVLNAISFFLIFLQANELAQQFKYNTGTKKLAMPIDDNELESR